MTITIERALSNTDDLFIEISFLRPADRFFPTAEKLYKRPKMGLYRSPDIHWCHRQEYGLEELVKTLEISVLTSLY